MSPTTRRMTVSDWEAGISRHREPRTFAADATALDVLRQRFRDISTRTREHRQSAWINRPGFAALKNISDQALELTRLAFHEMSQFDTPNSSTIPLHFLSQLLTENQQRLAEIDSQRKSLESALALATLLRVPLESLVEGAPMPFGPWKALIVELLSSALTPTLDQSGVWRGAALDGCLAAEQWPQAWFYSPAIHHALWTVKLRSLLPELKPYPIDALILPALLADCGLLIVNRDEGQSLSGPPSPSSPGYRRHSEISAALISRIDNASPLSGLLASQHHERLDGTGFPRRLKAEDLSPLSRCFAILVRWSELLQSSAAASSAADARVQAARTMSREAWQGAFDARIVDRLLSAIQLNLSESKVDADRDALGRPWDRTGESSSWQPSLSAESAAPVRIIDGAETMPPPARISAFKESGPWARPTPPPRPAVAGNR